jgi:protein subunit release factor B
MTSVVNLMVSGPYAYGYLSTEMGVHRLVRISPFNSQGKRQTSFSAVDVLPVFEETKVELPEQDIEVITFRRASGAGGQNVNKVALRCRIRHLPWPRRGVHERARRCRTAADHVGVYWPNWSRSSRLSEHRAGNIRQ